MKRVLGTIAVGLALGTSVVACGSGDSSPPQPVTVVQKEHENGEWETKKTTCKTWKAGRAHTNNNCKTWNTKKEWDDEDYVLHLSDGREVEVSVAEFATWQEGQRYNG